MDEAVALVERVRASAEKHAERALNDLAAAVPGVCGITLRSCPPLPPTIPERITDYRARNVADWVMYRVAFARAAESRGWRIHWYDAKNVPEQRYIHIRDHFGPPWTKDHRIAMAAAVAAAAAMN